VYARLARDSGLFVFGSELFEGGNSLFDANAAGAVDENYTLGAGDRLVLILTGDVENAYNLQVTREGFIVVPQVGQLFVANLTLGDLNRLLAARLGRVYSGVRSGTTRFSVSVAQLRSNQVFVVGDVQSPGSYRVSSAGTALTALYAAGGPSETGSLRRIEIRRGGRVVDVLDVYDYLLRGDASRDVRLRQGDVVFVPPRLARVRAVGEVLRPATYELKRGETLDDLLRAAGGYTAVAAPRQITIDRVLPPEQRAAGGRDRVVLTVNATGDAAAPAMPLVNGDVVRVARIAARVRNRVAVRGNVWNAGTVGFRPGLTVSSALRAAGGVKPDTYLGQLLVTRLQPDSSRIQLRAVLRDTTGAVYQDFALQDEDEIEVFSVTSFRPERYVAIGGAVRNPGRFRYRAGMTLRDMVLLAGGLQEGALLTEAEIARLPETRANGVTARTVRVPLDSSYLFDRGGAGTGAGYVSVPGVSAPAGGTAEVVLAPYDNVLILRQPDFQLQRTVFVGGEVRFPGRYALRQRTERLSELLSRAGGLTAEGYADGVTFFRLQGNTGRVGIDLPRVLREPRDRDNFILQDGDSIVVPTFNPVVRVTGAVNAPAAVAYVPGRSLDYYVRASGGGGRNADLGRAYVQQPNGKVESVIRRRFLPDNLPTPRAGAQIVVPERTASLPAVAQAAGAFAQIATALTALIGVIIALR
jgi:protein involved in polysaccharide export with SLBB domain